MRLKKLAVRTGLEPATPCVTGRYSNQLNYRTKLLFDCLPTKATQKYGGFLNPASFFQKKITFFSIPLPVNIFT